MSIRKSFAIPQYWLHTEVLRVYIKNLANCKNVVNNKISSKPSNAALVYKYFEIFTLHRLFFPHKILKNYFSALKILTKMKCYHPKNSVHVQQTNVWKAVSSYEYLVNIYVQKVNGGFLFSSYRNLYSLPIVWIVLMIHWSLENTSGTDSVFLHKT